MCFTLSITHKARARRELTVGGGCSMRIYQKPTVTALTTKHPATTSHALRPPSGKSSSSSIVDTVITWATASILRPFWHGVSSAENITRGKGGREKRVENPSQEPGHEVVGRIIVAHKVCIPSVMVEGDGPLRTPLHTRLYVQSV